jgi:uncharacterized RDD family membrane protein YckC
MDCVPNDSLPRVLVNFNGKETVITNPFAVFLIGFLVIFVIAFIFVILFPLLLLLLIPVVIITIIVVLISLFAKLLTPESKCVRTY